MTHHNQGEKQMHSPAHNDKTATELRSEILVAISCGDDDSAFEAARGLYRWLRHLGYIRRGW